MENIKSIINETNELNKLIDKKCIEINKINNESNIKIEKYKMMMENIILEYHKICKEKLIK
jgi:hypothetical protein